MYDYDGRYEHVTSLFSSVPQTEAEAEELTEKWLDRFDKKDDKGRYIEDLETWDVKPLRDAMMASDIRAGRNTNNLRESLGTSSFPQAIGGLISKRILRSHDDYNMEFQVIGEQLVNKVPTKKKKENVIRVSAHPLFKFKVEGVDAEPFEFEEDYISYRTNCYARNISVTNELIQFDNTEQLWAQAKEVGRGAALSKEYLILHGILDLSTTHQMGLWDAADDGNSVRVWRPKDVITAFYSASLPLGSTNGNLVTSNAFVDWTDLQAVKNRMNKFFDDTPEKLNDNSTKTGKFIKQPLSRIILAPDALSEKLWQVLGTRLTPYDSQNAKNPAGPGGPLNAPYLTSVILDEQSASTWYYGSPKETFDYREVYPFRVLTMNRADSLDMIKKGLYGFVQGEFYAGLAAKSNYFWCKSTA